MGRIPGLRVIYIPAFGTGKHRVHFIPDLYWALGTYKVGGSDRVCVAFLNGMVPGARERWDDQDDP